MSDHDHPELREAIDGLRDDIHNLGLALTEGLARIKEESLTVRLDSMRARQQNVSKIVVGISVLVVGTVLAAKLLGGHP
jgi:uncharacterized membrane protein YczE